MKPTDPRWIMALRTSEALEGTLLRPEKRESLLRLGRIMGLRPFDCNLIFAIVQDQARRGYAPQICARAGIEQLEMIPLRPAQTPSQRRLSLAVAAMSLVMMEVFMVWWWLGR